MKPSFLNLFMKKLTRARVVPTISASISWLIFAITGSGLPSLPKFASSRSTLGTFLARIEQLIDQVLFDADRPRQKVRHEHLGKSLFLTNEANNADFSSRTIAESAIVTTVAMRLGCPARRPSPKKSSGPRIATTASLPCSDATVTLTFPLLIRTRHPQVAL